MEDHSKTNPGLHLLCTKWACSHLRLIDKAIKRFDRESNLMLWDTIEALQIERKRLIKNNKAYQDAQEILEILKLSPKTETKEPIEIEPS